MSGASEECRQPSGGVAMRVGRAFLVVLKIQLSIGYLVLIRKILRF